MSKIYDERLQVLLGERAKDSGRAAVRRDELETLIPEIITRMGSSALGDVRFADVTADHLISNADAKSILLVDASQDVTITLPADVSRGLSCMAVRTGPGEVIWKAQAGAAAKTFVPGHSRIAGRWGVASFLCLSRKLGNETIWLVKGDTR